MKVEKLIAILFLLIALLQAGASQDIETWTDHESVNTGGDTIEIDYPGIEKTKLTGLRINESEKVLKEFNDSREEVFVEYDESLNGSENLTLEYKLNESDWRTKNIKENLTTFKTEFLGFFRDSDRLTRQIYYRELDNVRVKVNVSKTDGNSTSNVEGLLGEDFEVYSQGSKGKFELDGSSSSPYYLKFSGLPKMDPGTDRFRIKLKHGPDIRQFKVQKRVPFQGQVIGYGGTAKDATFEIIDSSINKFQTDETGKFEELLEKRQVNKKIKLYLGDVTTTFGGLELQSDRKEDIRYEYYRGFSPEEIKTDKLLDPLNLVGFSSNYPIEISETQVTMEYNSSGINPESVNFYECSYWDFLGKECRTNWEKKDEDNIEHDDIRNEATLNNLETKGDGDYGLKSAYMAAVEYERPFLKLEEPLIEEKQWNVEDSIDLDGNIKDGKNDKQVKDVNIEVILENDENESIKKYRGVNQTTNTNEDGLFSFKPIEIPDKEGSYTLKFEASKPGFENLSLTKELEVDKTLNMSLESPNEELVQGKTSSAVFDLENTGQTDISNISINETNMDPVYLTITPESINELESGDTKSITVSSILPSNYCNKKDCSRGLNLEVNGLSENGKSISSDSGLEIKYSVSEGKDSTNKSEAKGDNQQENSSENTQNSGKKDDKESNSTSEKNSSKSTDESSQDSINIPLTDEEIKNSAKEISLRIKNTKTETKVVLVAAILFAIATLKKRNDNSNRDLKIKPKINLEIGETNNIETDKKQMNRVDQAGRVSKPKIKSDNTQDTIKNSISSARSKRDLNKENNKCPECGESFDTSEALSVHLRTQHD